MSKRLEKDWAPVWCSVFFNCQRATFHVVFMLGFRRETFKGLSSVVTSMKKRIGDEIVIRGLDDSVVGVSGQIVKVGVTPVVGSIPVTVIVKPRDVVEH